MKDMPEKTSQHWIYVILKSAKAPFIFSVVMAALLLSTLYWAPLFFPKNYPRIQSISYSLLEVSIIVALYWLFIKIITETQQHMHAYLKEKGLQKPLILIDFFGNILKFIIFISFFTLVINYLPIPPQYIFLTDKLASIFIVLSISWTFIKLINLIEQLVAVKYQIYDAQNLMAQRTHTQIVILKRIAITVIILITIGGILMLFENIRQYGASILASAGLAGVAAAFAAQKWLNNFATDLQIALHQPIKLNDYIFVEGEFGQIEEITVNFVVVKLWDLRRLILPIQYFVEKPFQNWSYKSTDILGSVFLYLDYSIPLDTVREELQKIVKNSPLWDGNLCLLQVTDAKASSIEIRILVSTKNPAMAFDLRCQVREKLIAFINQHYPQSLPQLRMNTTELSSRQEAGIQAPGGVGL